MRSIKALAALAWLVPPLAAVAGGQANPPSVANRDSRCLEKLLEPGGFGIDWGGGSGGGGGGGGGGGRYRYRCGRSSWAKGGDDLYNIPLALPDDFSNTARDGPVPGSPEGRLHIPFIRVRQNGPQIPPNFRKVPPELFLSEPGASSIAGSPSEPSGGGLGPPARAGPPGVGAPISISQTAFAFLPRPRKVGDPLQLPLPLQVIPAEQQNVAGAEGVPALIQGRIPQWMGGNGPPGFIRMDSPHYTEEDYLLNNTE